METSREVCERMDILSSTKGILALHLTHLIHLFTSSQASGPFHLLVGDQGAGMIIKSFYDKSTH